MSFNDFRRKSVLCLAFAGSVGLISMSLYGLENEIAGLAERSNNEAAAQVCIDRGGDCTREQVKALERSYKGANQEAVGLTLMLGASLATTALARRLI